MTTCTIGFHGDDGDFQIVATLNNNDGIYADDVFSGIVNNLLDALQNCTDDNPHNSREFAVLYRQDAPDYVSLDD